MTRDSTPRRRCVVPDCQVWTDRGILCGPHHADVRAGRLQVKPGRCRTCGTLTKAEAYTYCEAHHRARRGREKAALVPDELKRWFIHQAPCSARDGAQLDLFVHADGRTPGLACRACLRTVAVRIGQAAEIARRELLAVGAMVEAPPLPPALPGQRQQAIGSYAVDCACGCGGTLAVPSKKPGLYYIDGHRPADSRRRSR